MTLDFIQVKDWIELPNGDIMTGSEAMQASKLS